MKKKFIFFTMLLLTLMGGVKLNVLNAQETVVEIGDGTINSLYAPTADNSAKYSVSQQLYLKEEINKESGSITKISFQHKYGNNNSRNIVVYMRNVDKESYSSASDWVEVSDEDIVYEGSHTFGTNDSWTTIELQTPFVYTGGDICITINDKTGVAIGYSGYDSFYSTLTGEYQRGIYATRSAAGSVAIDCSDLSGIFSYQLMTSAFTTPSNAFYVNNIRLTIEPLTPSVKITPESIDLGTVRTGGDFWTEKPFDYSNYAVTVKAQGGAYIVTNTIQQEGDFFKIVEVSPIPTDGGYYYHISYNQNGTTGEKEGTLVVTYKDSESATETKTATIPLSAVAYSSATDGEAIENPIEVAFTDNAFTHAATGMHDDYILPGEENDGNNGDAVYKFTLENDAVLTANVTGTNPIVAIYNEFGDNEGPSSDNNYEGVSNEPEAPSAPTTFFYDFDDGSLEDFNLIDADGDGYNWISSENTVKGYDGSKGIQSDSYKSTSLNPDNYIITQDAYLITSSSQLSYYVNAHTSWPSEQYSVLLIEDIEKLSSAEVIYNHTLTKNDINKTVTHDLSAYVGKIMHIAIRHHDCSNEYCLVIDNLQLTDGSAKSRSVAQTRSTNQIDRVLYPAGTYYLVAAAEGNFTLNLSTESLSAPAAATLTAPANEATEQNNPLLTWTLDKFAEEYQLLLGTTNPPTDVVVDWSAPATSYQTEGLANNTVYYWQVKSKNSVGESSSEVFSFVTPLNKPTNVAASKTNLYPGDETTISWTAAEGATSYNVYVGETKVASEVTETSYTLSGLEYNVNPGYNVTVTANHTLGESAKSDAVVVKMTAKSDVTITVKNAAGTPVKGASVRIYNGQDQYGAAITEQTFTTDDNGQVNEQLLYLNNYYSYNIEVTKVPYATNTSETISYYYMNKETYSKDIELQLAAPTGFVAESYNVYPEQNIVLSWNEVAEATSYKVYRRGAYSYTTYDYEYTELGETTDLTYSVETPEYNMTGVYYSLEAVYNEGVSPKATLANPVKVTGYGSFTATVNVEGATMKLEGTDEFGAAQTYEIVADENGSYASDKVLAGSYTATASAFGYNDATATVTVEYNVDANYNFVMTEKPTAPENLLKDVAVAEEYGAAKVTWTGANNNTQMYNIYRKNVETGDVELVAENKNDSYGIYDSYTDAAYAGLDDGTYQYGVTTRLEQNKEYINNTFGYNNLGTGWTTSHTGSNTTYDWTPAYNYTCNYTTIYGYSSYAAFSKTGRYFNDYGVNKYYLNAPQVDLTDAMLPILSFYYLTPNYYYYNDEQIDTYTNSLKVQVSTDGETWSDEWKNEKKTNTTWKQAIVDLSKYKGQKIYIRFETDTYGGYCSAIDDVLLKSEYSSETNFVWSNTIKKGGIVFTNNGGEGDGKWETASNWSNGEVPANDGTAEVTIKAAATISSEVNVKYLAINGGSLTLESTAVLTANEIVNDDEYTFIINDGAQLFHNSDNVKASFTMGIVNPEGEWNENNKTGWQFIASPFTEAFVSTFVPAQGNNYDLYRYAGSADKEWDNHKDNYNDQSWWYFNPGEGYLASYETLDEATLRGTLNSGLTYSWNNYYYDYDKPLANFHLLGNPFTFNMDMTQATFTNLVQGVAIVNNEGGYSYDVDKIPVGDGFFVQAIEPANATDPASLSYGGRGAKSEKSNSLNITATGNAGKDNVVINFAGKSEGFNKLQNFNDAIATVYVAEDGKNYGIYNCDADVQEVELSFNANQMGNYTISIEPNGKFQSVTLVDRFTGVETNMLVEDYHFTAMSEESPNRFIVRMVNGQQTTDNSHFVYQSGEELILNIQGDVQIVDVLGRVVYSGEAMNDINRINVSSFNSGAYMVRVMNGNDVKVEKVVIY